MIVLIHSKLELGLLGGREIQTIEIGLVCQGPCCHDVITLSMIMLPLLKTHISSTTRALKMTVITLEVAAAIYHLKRWFELEPQSSKNPKRERRKKKKFINYITCDQPEHSTMVLRSKYYS